MSKIIKKLKIKDKYLELQTGYLAKKTNGSVLVKYGDATLLAVVVADFSREVEGDFVPLTVDFVEKYYSSGKIPGGFFKREGKPSLTATSMSRLIDRTLRPLFPVNYRYETQVTITILSYDGDINPAWLSVIGASAALSISDIPFNGPIGAMCLGYSGNNYIIAPTDKEDDVLDLTISLKDDTIYMLDAQAVELSNEVILKGIEYSKPFIESSIVLQEELVKEAGRKKINYSESKGFVNNEILSLLRNEITTIMNSNRHNRLEEIESFFEKFTKRFHFYHDQLYVLRTAYDELVKKLTRQYIISNARRLDGRGLEEIREISIETSPFPIAHGAAVFSRGRTQALGVTTLGNLNEQQIIDDLDEGSKKRFFLHYNFPKFSVGEVGPYRNPGRREIGHGALAEKAIVSLLPSEQQFPYTIRIVSDILESNGSSSMASVCAGSLSLMLAGVPIKSHIAGVSIGLIREGNKYALLTDIRGFEDNIGDMDLKIAGTIRGITAIQLDIKGSGIELQIIKEAFEESLIARTRILKEMDKAISAPKKELPSNVPKIEIMKILPEEIGLLIGKRGENINSITKETHTKIRVDNDGIVKISYLNVENLKKAMELIKSSLSPLKKLVLPDSIGKRKPSNDLNRRSFNQRGNNRNFKFRRPNDRPNNRVNEPNRNNDMNFNLNFKNLNPIDISKGVSVNKPNSTYNAYKKRTSNRRFDSY